MSITTNYEKFPDKTTPKYTANDGLFYVAEPLVAVKMHPKAEVPYLDFEKEAGFNLQIVERCNNREEDATHAVNTFTTGLKIRCPKHYHAEIFPHPALWKSGYMLMGPLIIQSKEVEEEVIIPLLKFLDGDDIELPMTVGILVLRLTERVTVSQVAQRKVTERVRYEEENLSENAPIVKRATAISRNRNLSSTGPRNSHIF